MFVNLQIMAENYKYVLFVLSIILFYYFILFVSE